MSIPRGIEGSRGPPERDDSPNMQMLLKRLWRRSGYEVVEGPEKREMLTNARM